MHRGPSATRCVPSRARRPRRFSTLMAPRTPTRAICSRAIPRCIRLREAPAMLLLCGPRRSDAAALAMGRVERRDGRASWNGAGGLSRAAYTYFSAAF